MKTGLRGAAAKGMLWMFSATLGQNLLQLVSLVILARLLTPEDFGVVAAAMIIVELLRIFSEGGVGPAVVQLKAINEHVLRTANTLALALGVSLGVGVYFSAHIFAAFFSMEELGPIISVLAVILPVTGLTVVGQALLQRKMQFKRIGLYAFLSYLVSHGVIAIPLAIKGFGLWSLVFAALARAATMFLLIRVTYKGPQGFEFSLKGAKALLGFGLGQSLGQVANYLANQGDNLVVGKLLGSESLGYYSRAYQLMLLPAGLIGTVVDNVLFPIMASIQDERERLAKAYILLISLINMLAFPLSVLIIVLADEVVGIVLGEQWHSVVPIFQVLVMILAFRTSYKVSDSLCRARGAVYRRAWRQVIYALMVVGGAYVGHHWGLVGVATGVSLAVFGNFLLMISLSRNLIFFGWRLAVWANLKHLVVAFWVGAWLVTAKSLIVTLNVNSVWVLVICTFVFFAAVLSGWYLMRKLLAEEWMFIVSISGHLK